MSKENLGQLQATGRVPATSETFISPSQEYAQGYEGTTVRFTVRAGRRMLWRAWVSVTLRTWRLLLIRTCRWCRLGGRGRQRFSRGPNPRVDQGRPGSQHLYRFRTRRRSVTCGLAG